MDKIIKEDAVDKTFSSLKHKKDLKWVRFAKFLSASVFLRSRLKKCGRGKESGSSPGKPKPKK